MAKIPCLFPHQIPDLRSHLSLTMQKLLLLAGLLLASASLPAQSFIVYAKSDYSFVDATNPSSKPTDAVRAAFLAGVQAELAHPTAYETHMTLLPAPAPKWGKVVDGAKGSIDFHDSFKGGMLLHVKLEGLVAGHTYRLCLNGNPKLAGNDLLVDPVPGNPAERYYDFFTAVADAQGRYDATFGIGLPAAPYELRFYVKDVADHTIFLYHDFFKFAVE